MSTALKTAKKKARPQIGEGTVHRLRAENARLRSQLKKRPKLLEDGDPDLPTMPPADENGQYPAIETARVIIARQIIRGRKAAGWTQAELAARAGIRPGGSGPRGAVPAGPGHAAGAAAPAAPRAPARAAVPSGAGRTPHGGAAPAGDRKRRTA